MDTFKFESILPESVVRSKFEDRVKNTPWKNARLVKTGERTEKRREGSDAVDVWTSFEIVGEGYDHDIDGHSLWAIATGAGHDFAVFPISAVESEINESFVKSLHGGRCDICGKAIHRKKLFAVKKPDGSVIVVGGSCADTVIAEPLSVIASRISDEFEAICNEFSGRVRQSGEWSLAREIAAGEFSIRTHGFFPKSAGGKSTSTHISVICYGDRRDSGISIDEDEKITARAIELVTSELSEYIAKFEAKVAAKWSLFDSNILSFLKVARPSTGIAAVVAKEGVIGAVPKSDPIPAARCVSGDSVDGWFRVIKTDERSACYGYNNETTYVAVTAIDEAGNKIWFKTSSKGAFEAFNSVLKQDEETIFCFRWTDKISIKVQGKVSGHGDKLSFINRPKVTAAQRGE